MMMRIRRVMRMRGMDNIVRVLLHVVVVLSSNNTAGNCRINRGMTIRMWMMIMMLLLRMMMMLMDSRVVVHLLIRRMMID